MNPKIFVDYEAELFTRAPNRGHYPITFTLDEQNPWKEPRSSMIKNGKKQTGIGFRRLASRFVRANNYSG